MRLAGLLIRNYKRISNTECGIRIDEIVVLIGRNNTGKSTVLDAYEAFASGGKELDESHFNNGDLTRPIEITGVFDRVSAEDLEVIGKKWCYADAEYGECIKVKWVWTKPGQKAQKQSFNPETGQFEDGGVGGWDSLIQSRIPQPVRIRPTDPIDITQTKIVNMLKEHVKASLKADSSSTKAALDEIERLTEKLFAESKSVFDDVANRITSNVSQVFPGTTIELIARSKDPIDEKVVGADSYIKIGNAAGAATPLAHQGTGVQRALLWSALSVMADFGGGKKKAKNSTDVGRILLIDEPEAFLHPPTVRGAREALYDFALKNSDWQVIATTHSPIFIDVSKDHTTIVRVDPDSHLQHFVSTDDVEFQGGDRARLQMVRACNPNVNEFFFYDNIILVEGPTEHVAVQHVAAKLGVDVHVINCMGKANIPLFANILNHFKIGYVVIHDSDTPKIQRKGKMVNSGTWTINETIRATVAKANSSHIFTQFPHFEGEFLDDELSGGKVDSVLELLGAVESAEYLTLIEAYTKVLQREGAVFTTDQDAFERKLEAYITKKKLEADPRWAVVFEDRIVSSA